MHPDSGARPTQRPGQATRLVSNGPLGPLSSWPARRAPGPPRRPDRGHRSPWQGQSCRRGRAVSSDTQREGQSQAGLMVASGLPRVRPKMPCPVLVLATYTQTAFQPMAEGLLRGGEQAPNGGSGRAEAMEDGGRGAKGRQMDFLCARQTSCLPVRAPVCAQRSLVPPSGSHYFLAHRVTLRHALAVPNHR